ncbi:MAG: alpha/beta fold hydrolase [Chloroflexota bacterium]
MWKQQESIAPGRTTCPNLYRLGASLEGWAASVLALVSPKEPIVVIGSFMGGSCAIEMARQAPNRIAALVLVGTKAGHRPEPELRDAYIQSLRSNGINEVWLEVRNHL